MTHHSNPRIRQPHHFEQRRTTSWAIELGFHHGQGLSSTEIAKKLGDGTGPATVRTVLQKANLPSPGRRKVVLPLNLESWERDILQRHADERGISVHELLYRMIKDGLIHDDLYDAVTDGRYDK